MTFHGLSLGAFTPQGSYALLLLVVLGLFWVVVLVLLLLLLFFVSGTAPLSPDGAVVYPELFACCGIWYICSWCPQMHTRRETLVEE